MRYLCWGSAAGVDSEALRALCEREAGGGFDGIDQLETGTAPQEQTAPPRLERGRRFDLLLAADCTYEWSQCETLAATVAERLADGGVALVASSLRPGGCEMAAANAQRLAARGLRVAARRLGCAESRGCPPTLLLTADRKSAPHAWGGSDGDAPREPEWCAAGSEGEAVADIARAAVAAAAAS